MDVPAPSAGTVKEVKVKVGTVSEGSPIVLPKPTPQRARMHEARRSARAEGRRCARARARTRFRAPSGSSSGQRTSDEPAPRSRSSAPVDAEGFKAAHASPSVRNVRELGVDLARVAGPSEGPHPAGDVQNFVKGIARRGPQGAAAGIGGGALNLLPWPTVDFAKFGPVEPRPLTRIKKIPG